MILEYNIEDRNNFFYSGSDLYWDDIKNENNIPYDDELIDIVKFEDDMYNSWIDWCNDKYADVDEEAWWSDVCEDFDAEDYIIKEKNK